MSTMFFRASNDALWEDIILDLEGIEKVFILCYFMLFYVILCYFMLFYVILCYFMLFYVILFIYFIYLVLFRYVIYHHGIFTCSSINSCQYSS